MAQEALILENYLWKNRIVILFAPHDSSVLLRKQYATLKSDFRGLKERDLLLIRVVSDQVEGEEFSRGADEAQQLRRQYQIADNAFCVVLIGKDGSEKIRSNDIVSRDELYAVIDAMPMRRQEMKKKGEY